jgi:hypothetical protein
MPHHMEDLERQIPYSLEKIWSQIPGISPGDVKFRIDRYISNTFEIHLKSVSTFSYAESNGGIFILIAPLGITNTRTNLVRVICQQYVTRAICQQYNFAWFSKAINR